MIKNTDKLFAEELVKKGVFSQAEAEKLLAALQPNETLKDAVLRTGKLNENQVLETLMSVFQMKTVDWRAVAVDKAVLEKVPVRFAWYYKFMPIKIDGKMLSLATSYPLDVKIQDEIRVHLGLEPQMLLARESDVSNALNKHYGLGADTINRILSKESKSATAAPADPGQESSWVENVEKESEDASVAKLVNQIILEAYKKRATDIHIEPYRNKVRVRYRIDGVLMDANLPPAVKHFLPSIISRIKIMANLSIVEKRLPQDGSTVVSTKEQALDLRISTIPTPHGESMVIRILPTKVTLLNLEKLGLDAHSLKVFRSLIKKPHGIILVTGPTGSGKTTTLYACLQEINSAERKIITIEDPVEYEMEGATQIQVNTKVNLDFATGLRSVLRHDPDVIMVGEIRDLETAEIAIRTALTGHLVFSTLHTNDAASAVTRLIEMGLEPFLVASSVEAFIAQRLVRILCPKCREEVKDALPEIREEMAKSLGLAKPADANIWAGRGCDHCNFTGFYGRTAIYEMLVVSEEVRRSILGREKADDIKNLAIRQGMVSMRQDGWKKVQSGVTTPAEIMNVTVRDDDAPAAAPVPSGQPAARGTGEAKSRIVAPEVLSAKNEYELRAYARAAVRVGVRYQIVRQDEHNPSRLISDGIEHSSITKDLSAGGVRFVSGYTLPLGTILELKIQLEKTERSIDCLAKVCRVEDDSLSAMFSLVVYYLDMTSADRVKIDAFVKAKLAESPAAQVMD
ncbi:MAG: ATPase, T2SS/T4P/T4SS family [Candidatus Omnitrophota bacterium]|nr:ATPase, T2SS/T4P/T4SS family [Candidatus Omnitrophota bacterium]